MRQPRRYTTVRGLLADRRRWCKFTPTLRRKNGTVAYCLAGAIREVNYRQGYSPEHISRIDARVIRTIRVLFPRRINWQESIMRFNDDRRTTHADVLRVARKARV